jgi:CubicO group peptidase (beta-lactamase class C family)
MLTTSCVVTRAIRYGNASVDDHRAFDQEVVSNGDNRFRFAELPMSECFLDTMKFEWPYYGKGEMQQHTIDEVTRSAVDNAALIIIHRDTILYERYFGEWNIDTQSQIFSVTKSITSMLCGVALNEGYIHSLDDSVTDYIPELKDADPTFSRLKIKHLLDMTAGLDFDENYTLNPFSKMAKLYMGGNSMRIIENTKFSHEPGERYHYNSLTTAILGIVIERATGIPYAEYLSQKVWQPLGMEQSATISIDDKKHRVAKSYAGLVTNVRDLAKVGRLYLNYGNWNGEQILDSTFVRTSLSPRLVGEKNLGLYSNSWYWGTYDEELSQRRFANKREMNEYYKEHPTVSTTNSWRDKNGDYIAAEYMRRRYFADRECLMDYYNNDVHTVLQTRDGYFAVQHNGGYYAFGVLGQILYINPEKEFIGVYLGEDDFNVKYLFEKICEMIENK